MKICVKNTYNSLSKKKKKTYNSKNVFDTIFQIIYFKMLKKHNYMFGISMWFFIYKKVMIVCIVKEYYFV